ncbi:mitochondrial carrier [Hymenopellis radicata]|nr:mitochondrial carrier [Hymenopellis radicata]
MLGFFDLILLAASICITLAVIVPLTGVLVRFRANYNPKGLQLDAEGGAEPHTGPVVKSYFAMLKRVYQIEGWPGLYKGLMPTFLSTAVVTLMLVLFMDTERPRHGTYHAPAAGIIGTLVYSVGMMLIALPTAIITYRAITTPHKLPYFNAAKSLRVLLTPTERRRPWIIYFTPGLLAAEVSHIVLVVLGLTPLRRLLLPAPPSETSSSLPEISAVKIIIYFVVVALFTFVLTPLEVIATRLAIQRNHASAEYNSVSQEVDGDGEDVGEFAGAEEDVIGLRNEEDPYIGLVDCAKRIIDEEGWFALYRAWWITFLGTLSSGLTY